MSEEESSVEARGAMETKERVAVVLHESKLEKTFRAVCLNGAILAVGLSLGLIGTALPDLQSRTNTGFDALTKIFIGRGFGFLVGSIASNYLLSLANQACWITSALVVLAVTIATIPNCTSLALLMGTLFLQGAACGVIKAGCGFICRHHFSRVDLAWGKTLFISFAVGAFIAPLLLLPFTSVEISGTFKTGSMRFNGDLPVRTSPVSTRMAPARSGLIAPNILARFHRKRRSVEEDMAGFLLPNETNATIGSIEMSTVLAAEEEEISVGDVAKETPVPFESTEGLDTGEGGKKLGSSTTSGFLMEIVRVTDGKESGWENSSVVPSPGLSTVTPPGSATPAAEGVNGSTSLPSQISSTVVGTSTTKAIPKKPFAADGGMLSSDAKVADSSKFRDEIRDKLKMAIPEDPGTKTSTTLHAPKTPSSSTAANSPPSAPGMTGVPLSVNKDVDLTTKDAEQAPTMVSVASLSPTNTTSSAPSSPPGPVQSSISLSNQSPLQTPTSPSTQSPTPPSTSSSTPTPVPPSTLSPASSTPSSSTLTSQKSTLSPTLASSKTTTANNSTTTQTTPKSISVTRPNDIVTEDENPTEKPNLGQLWLTKYSYWLSAIVVGLSATSFAFYWVLCPRVYQTGMSPSSEELQTVEPPKVVTSCRVPAFLVVALFHLLYAGLEVTFGMLVTSFAVLRLGWSGRLGVLLGATYWGSFVTCRIVTFILFRYVRQSLMMLGGLLLCIVVTGGAFVSFHHELCESNAFVWVTVGALGFGMAAVLPGGVSEIDKVFPRQAELFQMLGSSVGEMVLPPVLGIVMTIEDSVWLAYIVLAAFVLCTVIAIAIRVLVVRSSEGRVPRSARSLPSLENDDLEDVLTNTNDETELLAKSSHSQTGSPLNGSGNGTQAVTQMAIQSLMKNISNTKKD